MGTVPWAATTKRHRRGSLHKGSVFSPWSGGWTSEIEVWAGRVLPEAALCGRRRTSSVCLPRSPLRSVSQSPHSVRSPSCWGGTTRMSLFYLHHLFTAPSPNAVTFECWRSGLGRKNLGWGWGRHNFDPNSHPVFNFVNLLKDIYLKCVPLFSKIGSPIW